jgi:hypothetical protein
MDYDSFDRQAWDEHGDAPEAVAGRFAEACTLVRTPAQAAACTRLVAHVLGEHLGRWSEALEHITALTPRCGGDAAASATLARHTAALRQAAGDGAALDGLAAGERIAALALAAGLLGGRGEFARAMGVYDEAESLAAAGLPDGAPALRALAVSGNNLAAGLEERAQRSAAEDAAMLRAAAGGLRWWRRAGTWLEEERAHWRLARCRLAAGDAVGAAAAAADGLAVCAAHQAPAFETFFLHVVMAHAGRARADEAAYAGARQAALDAHAQVGADEQPWCKADLETIR